LLLGALNALHGVVVEAEVVAELVDDPDTDQLFHVGLVGAIFLDRSLIDVDRVGQDVAVARAGSR